MKAYIAIKFHKDNKNKETIEEISLALKENKIDSVCLARDVEDWGKNPLKNSGELMKKAFSIIDECQIIITEFTEKGVGTFIETGYAYAKNKPIIAVARAGTKEPQTLQGISQKIIYYSNSKELKKEFRKIYE